jgi:hypothetical protein
MGELVVFSEARVRFEDCIQQRIKAGARAEWGRFRGVAPSMLAYTIARKEDWLKNLRRQASTLSGKLHRGVFSAGKKKGQPLSPEHRKHLEMELGNYGDMITRQQRELEVMRSALADQTREPQA